MDHISLNSNNHDSNLVNLLDHFKALNSFVDVTLVCEGHTVKAHKIILSAGSNVLHRLLLANPAKHPIIVLTETKYDTLRLVIDFLYKGKIDVRRNDLKRLLAIAATFEMNELKKLCEENLSDESETVNSHSCSKSQESNGSSPRKNWQLRRSLDSDILSDSIFMKREASCSPSSEQPEVPLFTDILSPQMEFLPQIADTRSLDKTSMDCSTDTDLVVTCIKKKDASTECDIQPLKELKSNLMPIEPSAVVVRSRCIEKSDDSESYIQNKLKALKKRKRSIVWEYFTAVTPTYAVCKLCRAKYSYKTTVTNLTKHIRNKHHRFDPKHPPKLPDVPLLRIQDEQLEIFEEIDFNNVVYEAGIQDDLVVQDDEHPKYEEALEEGIPSTSTPCILKIN